MKKPKVTRSFRSIKAPTFLTPPALKAAPTFRLLPHVKASKGEDLFSIRALDGRPKHKREKEHVRCRRDCSHRQAAQTIVSGVITGRTLHRIHQRKWIAGKRSTK